tara:strand:+ start:273 stop:392 length:120 start_codon:yes stop_codon:yes gene_type:complete
MSEIAYLIDKYGQKDYIQYLEDKIELLIENNQLEDNNNE